MSLGVFEVVVVVVLEVFRLNCLFSFIYRIFPNDCLYYPCSWFTTFTNTLLASLSCASLIVLYMSIHLGGCFSISFGWELFSDILLAFSVVLSHRRGFFLCARRSVICIYDQSCLCLLSSCYLGPIVCLRLCGGVVFGKRLFVSLTC